MLSARLSRNSSDKVRSITGIDSDQIRLLAREFAAAESAVCYGRIGVSTQGSAAASQWLINVLNIVTGNFRIGRAGPCYASGV